MTVVSFSVVIDHIPFFFTLFFSQHNPLIVDSIHLGYGSLCRKTGYVRYHWISWKFTSTSGRMMIDSTSFRVAIPHVPKKYHVRNSRRTRPNWRSSDYCLGLLKVCWIVSRSMHHIICLYVYSRNQSMDQ